MELNSVLDNLKDSFIISWNNFIIQVPNIVAAILIIALGFLLSNFISNIFRKTISKKTKDPLMSNFLAKTIKLSVLVLIIFFALNIAGFSGIATGIITAAGASAVIIGFAFRDIGENFISGVILSFNRPFNINDTVSIGDIFGRIKNMEFRYTKMKTFDGRDVYIPNSDVIKKAVFNYTEDGYYRLDFLVGVAYEDSIEEAENIILESVRSTDGVIEDDTHETFVAVDELATSTVNLRVYFWVKTLEYRKEALKIKSKVQMNVKRVILENGLNLPADIKEIKLYGNQTSFPVMLKNEDK